MIEAQDKDIDCTLFRALQQFLVAEMHHSQRDALVKSRDFMRRYWLGRVSGLTDVETRAM